LGGGGKEQGRENNWEAFHGKETEKRQRGRLIESARSRNDSDKREKAVGGSSVGWKGGCAVWNPVQTQGKKGKKGGGVVYPMKIILIKCRSENDQKYSLVICGTKNGEGSVALKRPLDLGGRPQRKKQREGRRGPKSTNTHKKWNKTREWVDI